MENPQDKNCEPFPSIFNTCLAKTLLDDTGGTILHLDQCMFGAGAKKGTSLAGTASGLFRGSGPKCCHVGGHPPIRGKDQKGVFLSSGFQRYPPLLCTYIAGLFGKGVPPPSVSAANWKATSCRATLPSVWTKVLGPVFELPRQCLTSLPPNSSPSVKPPWWQNDERLKGASLLKHYNWKLAFALDSFDSAHINVKELRGVRLYIRRRARAAIFAQKGERLLILCDSKAATGAVNHGRSPSAIFNSSLRRMLPELLAADLYACVIWIPSEANPADPPSRRRPVWTWKVSVEDGEVCAKKWKRSLDGTKRHSGSGPTSTVRTGKAIKVSSN